MQSLKCTIILIKKDDPIVFNTPFWILNILSKGDDWKMICQKCGAENPEDSSFCNKCGANLLLVNKKKDRLFVGIINKMKLFSSKRNVIILCSVLAFIICLSVGLAYLNDPISSFKSDIRNNNYINAVKIYNEKIKGNTNKENNANWFLKDEILKIEKSFIEGKINFDTAKTRLETIRKTQLVSVDVITTIDKITKLNDSKIAFSKAEEFLKNKDVVNAIKEYKKVIQDDQNYERAREQIINNEKQYKEQVLKGAEDSANANNYDKAISLLRVALSLMPNDSDLNSRLSVYQKEFEEKLAALQLVIVESAKIIVQDSRYKVL